ncbi:preprotein translocase subunit SecY [Chitinophaga defluvii]|uniref:Protein translocase subunit SecY n=1 Tax=Chitinophaga defluvii TaxID=3163343 RepID=A0ABV2TC08_9BACT
MKKFIDTIKNIWSIEDLRNRILTTLLLILIYRVGSYIVLPGIDANLLDNFSEKSNQGILGLFNMFAGGSFSRASIFALGIMPYISASIAIQLLTIAVPYFQKLQKEGESGRKKITQYTRLLTVVVTAFQASAYVAYLRNQSGGAIIAEYGTFFFWLSTTVILTAGTLFVMWLGEKITDKGIGNGTSIIIMVGILARLPQALLQEFTSRATTGSILVFLIEIAVFILITVGLILLVQGTRKIPVNYAKRIVGNKQYGGVRQFIPLKVNAAGVMPIIFAQAIMFIPATAIGFATSSESASGFVRIFSDHTNGWYNVIYAILVVVFTYFYTALIFNPNQMADEMKRNNGFIPGVKPGKATADYIGAVMDRITLPGAFFLALVGIMPGLAAAATINSNFASFFGGTSLLIMVGVILDTLQQIESQLLMRHYDGLMSTGRIKGRTAPANV